MMRIHCWEGFLRKKQPREDKPKRGIISLRHGMTLINLILTSLLNKYSLKQAHKVHLISLQKETMRLFSITLVKHRRKKTCKSSNYNNKTTISCSTSKITYSASKRRKKRRFAAMKQAPTMSPMKRLVPLNQNQRLSMVQKPLKK